MGNVRVQCRCPCQRGCCCAQEVYRALHTHRHTFRSFICIAAVLVFRIRVCCIKFESCTFSQSKREKSLGSVSLVLCLFCLFLALTIYSVNTESLLCVMGKTRKQLFMVRNTGRQIMTSNYRHSALLERNPEC